MVKLKYQICVAQLITRINGDQKTYTWKDTELISRRISLNEQERSSSCEIQVYDKAGIIANELIAKLESDGGFFIPQDLFKAATADTQSPGDTTGSADLSNITGGLKGDELATVIVSYAKSIGVTDTAQIAAMLGTMEIETSNGEFLEEIDDGSNYSYLGADAKWHGRGIVQLTGQSNYSNVGKLIGVDLIANPDAAKELKNAIPILCKGMQNGWFTKSKLADFGTGDSFDFNGSRDIVNPGEGSPRRDNYVDYCKKYYTRLKAGELSTGTVTAPTTIDKLSGLSQDALTSTAQSTEKTSATAITTLGQIVVNETINASEQAKTDKAITQASIEANKFSTLVISLGYSEDTLVDYTYIWTGIKVDSQRISLSGQSIDAAIHESTIAKTTRTYKNTSLKQFAQNVADELGIKLDIVESSISDENIETVNQYSNESKYQTLGRIAKTKAYFLRNTGNVLKLEPLIANANGYILDVTRYLNTPVYTEKASANRITGQGLPPIVQGLTKTKTAIAADGTTVTEPTTDLNAAIIRVYVNLNPIDDATGFIINDKGLFVTCEHVSKISLGYAILHDGTKRTFTIIASDPSQDIAIGKLEDIKDTYPYLQLSDRSGLNVGDPISAIGMSSSKEPWNVSTGNVTSIQSFGYTKAATIATSPGFIENGNSGSPIFDGLNGNVVAMAESINDADKTGRLIPIEIIQAYIKSNTTLAGSADTIVKPIAVSSDGTIYKNKIPSPIFTAQSGISVITDKNSIAANLLAASGINSTTNGTQKKDATATQLQIDSSAKKTDESYVSNVADGKNIDKGFELSLDYYCDDTLLRVLPGDIIVVPAYHYDSKISGEYRLGDIEHNSDSKSALSLYKPVWVDKPTTNTQSPLSKGSTVLNQPTQSAITDASQLENLTSLQFTNPIPTGVVSSYFGYRMHPIQLRRIRHNGTDYAAPTGDLIYAAANGVVAYANGGDNGSGYGNQVLIYHGSVKGDKIFALYGHNSEVLVTTGQLVKQGDKISKCGSTGQSTGSHLHFGVTIGADWGLNDAWQYPGNSSDTWVHPEKNFIMKPYTGKDTIDHSGQTDDGTT